LFKQYRIAVWWAARVEILSGLTRLQRMGGIGHDDFLDGKRKAESLAGFWDSVGPSNSVADDACSLLELHPLRAADALQLAAALEACEHRPRSYVFITADQRLADAARRTGFSVEFI
jgi:predicted nucleic acid-binding protein